MFQALVNLKASSILYVAVSGGGCFHSVRVLTVVQIS